MLMTDLQNATVKDDSYMDAVVSQYPFVSFHFSNGRLCGRFKRP